MTIRIARNYQTIGEFTKAEIIRKLHSGELLPSDTAWLDNEDEWRTLDELGENLLSTGAPSSGQVSDHRRSDTEDEPVDYYAVLADNIGTMFAPVLLPFEDANTTEELLSKMPANLFTRCFLAMTQDIPKSCEHIAGMLRMGTNQECIRGTPAADLAKQIREHGFGELDRIVEGYEAQLGHLTTERQKAQATANEVNLIDAGLRGAALGQLAGGLGKSGRNLGILEAWRAAGKEIEKYMTGTGLATHRYVQME